MGTNFRSLTLDERFFKVPTIIQVPISALPENLPPVSTAPVLPIPVPDLSAQQFHSPSFFSKTGAFIHKNKKVFIVLFVVGVFGTIYFVERKKKKAIKPNG